MKLMAIFFALSSPLWAQTQMEKICSSVVELNGDRIMTHAPSFHGHYAAYFSEGEYRVENKLGERIYSTPELIVGLVSTPKSIWFLTPSKLYELSFSGEILNYYLTSMKGLNKSLFLVENQLLVARGAGGILSFDLDERKVRWENRLGQDKDGWPVALTSDGVKGYAAVQSARENGFTGIMTFDLKNGAVLQRSSYHYAYGVIGIDVRASFFQGNVLLNNQGWIHLLSASQVASGKSIKPRWIAYQVPRNGDVNSHYMMLEGDFLLEGNELIGCGKYNAPSDQGITIKGKLFRVKLN